MFSYVIIDGGYEIFLNDQKIICQPHSPNRGFNVLLNKNEAEKIAKFICKKLELGGTPVVSFEEENNLLQELTDEQITQLAEQSVSKEKQIIQQQTTLEQRIADLEQAIAYLVGGSNA